ncbi:Holliday junction resolvase RuvX [Bifidobacterium bombi]|uniref:Putative pre-16S rRNA nuclease n=1 Tax=Bifidobacterium bombi DSM 19703 TaxID=1341695 RepID=A0A080N495_9BIFI|nr:Holliday junction resolvase RuvX [Bifidobacterium bombi]KFF31155.1 putative Holliday junction resolvase [Bifidobacterium bombi DSM 19703]
MVWLGIDLGEARVGIAMSDPELSFAHPEENLSAGGDSFRVLDDVVDIVVDYGVERVVIGLPLLLDGGEGKSAKKARRWATNLVKRLRGAVEEGRIGESNLPDVVMEDERLTTVSAHRQLNAAGLPGRAHRPDVDRQSAVLILQAALDRLSKGCEANER